MILADGISIPVVAVFGAVVLVPLTLAIVLVETAVIRPLLGIRLRSLFFRVLLANTLSTVVGVVIFAFQDAILRMAGIMTSIPAFVSGYARLAPLLVLLHFAGSLAVEAPVLAAQSFRRAANCGLPRALIAVCLANIVTYSALGPLFYRVTKPTFGGLDLVYSTEWTANAGLPLYYIDSQDHTIRKTRVDGGSNVTVVPFAASQFLISDDEMVIVYIGQDNNLYLFDRRQSEPRFVSGLHRYAWTSQVSLSPCRTRLAFTQQVEEPAPESARYSTLCIYDASTDSVSPAASLTAVSSWSWPVVAWSRDGERVYVRSEYDAPDVFICRATPPWGTIELTPVSAVADDELVLNYRRPPEYRMHEDVSGAYAAECWPGLFGHVRIGRDGENILFLRNDYGLLNLGLSPESVRFLAEGPEVLIEWWDQLYLLDIQRRRLGLVARGRDYVAPIPAFRARLHWPDAE